MKLVSANTSISIRSATEHTAAKPCVVACWEDVVRFGRQPFGNAHIKLGHDEIIEVVPGPSDSSNGRTITSINVRNCDTAAHKITVLLMDGADPHGIISAELAADEVLGYDGSRWYTLTADGELKTAPAS